MHTYFATAPKGLEDILAVELRALGLASATRQRGGAAFTGELEAGYRACLGSRVASRVLLALSAFPAPTPEALYEGVKAIDWSLHMGPTQTLAVDFASSRSAITHTHFGALKVKDAIVDQFRDRTGERPTVDTERPDVRINVHVHEDQATCYLDLSGDSLHRRGYREEGVAAPLKENLAAGLLLLAGWPALAEQGAGFYDPMCGSGTLPIEAALIAARIAPGSLRTRWGFSAWRQHDAALWERLLAEAKAGERREKLPTIWGTDQDFRAVRAALGNLERAGLRGIAHIEKRDFEAAQPPPNAQAGLVLMNPPYGERLGEVRELEPLYARMGELFRERFEHWRVAVLTSNEELARRLGLKPDRTHPVFNGPLACKLYEYAILPRLNRPEPKRAGPAGLPWGAPERAEAFANRLRKNLKHLRKWAKREGVTCFRAYDKDLPEYAVAVDLYDQWVHVQEYAPPATVDPGKARTRLLDLLAALPEALEVPVENIFLKTRERQKGGGQYEKLAEAQQFHTVREAGNSFLVNFTDYLDTGLFLDHRLTRALIGKLAKGQRFLNLFAYTATATVYAAQGKATSSVSVDMSNTYLDWARRNFDLNGMGREHHLVRADITEWLKKPEDKKFGLIFLDPPTFSKSKKMEETFDVQRDHVSLLRDASKWLAPGGTLVFSNNFRRFKLEEDQLPELSFEDITAQTIPPDFERNARIHKCWLVRQR